MNLQIFLVSFFQFKKVQRIYIWELYKKTSNMKLEQSNDAQNGIFHFECQRSFNVMRPAA